MKLEWKKMLPGGKEALLHWTGGILLAVLLCLLCVPGASRAGEEYSVVLLGDSVVGNTFDGEGIDVYLERLTGRSVLKGAFGGTRASYEEEEDHPYTVKEQLSLVKLSEAIVRRDFAAPRARIAYGERFRYTLGETLDYFPETINALSGLDFSKVRYLVIGHGSNDYNCGRKLDNPEDPLDRSTFGGALRYSVRLLQEEYPQMKIILMTPAWCYIVHGDERADCDDTDYGGGYLQDYVELEIRIAREYGLYLLDNFHDSGIGKQTQEQYLYDGLHLNRNGQQLIAGRIAELLEEIEDDGKEG